MSDTVISVENLSKKYLIGRQKERYSTLRDALADGARSVGNRVLRPFSSNGSGSNGSHEDFWALRDVSFEVKQGEVIGIIGRNGAGKSTLLKILSRITEPTAGRVRIRGRVASLLEVGTGFHPELTGRENIYLNGAILGMTRTEIKRKFDEIVAFAEVDKFIDTPVKRYSSGMHVRLAFAVAAHLEPEIMLVDEVLAVGDANFQAKCLGKMDKVARHGRTVFFVSHNMASIARLCSSSMRLSRGRIVDQGQTSSVISGYLRDSVGTEAVSDLPADLHLIKSPLQIRQASVLTNKDAATDTFSLGDEVRVRLVVEVKQPVRQARVGLGIYVEGVRVGTTHTSAIDFPASTSAYLLTCTLPQDLLLPNFYSLHVGAYSMETGEGLDWVPDAVSFRVEGVGQGVNIQHDERELGLVRIPALWESDAPLIQTGLSPDLEASPFPQHASA